MVLNLNNLTKEQLKMIEESIYRNENAPDWKQGEIDFTLPKKSKKRKKTIKYNGKKIVDTHNELDKLDAKHRKTHSKLMENQDKIMEDYHRKLMNNQDVLIPPKPIVLNDKLINKTDKKINRERKIIDKEYNKLLKEHQSIMSKERELKASKTKPKNIDTSTNSYKLYQRIMNNPIISKAVKKQVERNTNYGSVIDYEDLLALEQNEIMLNESWSDDDEPKAIPKPKKKISKLKQSLEKGNRKNVLNTKTDAYNENGKSKVITEVKIRKKLTKKEKEAIKKSIDTALTRTINNDRDDIDLNIPSDNEKKGRGIRGRNIDFDSSSDEDEPIKGRGNKWKISERNKEYFLKPKEEIQTLNHLLSHITDPNEKTDKRDIRDAKHIFNNIIDSKMSYIEWLNNEGIESRINEQEKKPSKRFNFQL